MESVKLLNALEIHTFIFKAAKDPDTRRVNAQLLVLPALPTQNPLMINVVVCRYPAPPQPLGLSGLPFAETSVGISPPIAQTPITAVQSSMLSQIPTIDKEDYVVLVVLRCRRTMKEQDKPVADKNPVLDPHSLLALVEKEEVAEAEEEVEDNRLLLLDLGRLRQPTHLPEL